MPPSPWRLRSCGKVSCLRRRETYQKLAKRQCAGRVLRGVRSRRPGHARRPLLGRRANSREGAAQDLTAKNPDRAAAKFAAIGDAELLRGQQTRRDRRRRKSH